jgi:hypothetical protein
MKDVHQPEGRSVVITRSDCSWSFATRLGGLLRWRQLHKYPKNAEVRELIIRGKGVMPALAAGVTPNSLISLRTSRPCDAPALTSGGFGAFK